MFGRHLGHRNWTSAAAAALLAAGVGLGASGGSAVPLSAHADISGCEDPNIHGTATLRERPSAEGVKQVDIDLRVSGMKPGRHAVHIHEVGQCKPCGEAKGHFDPGPAGNSSPDGNHPFHMGDLVNLVVDGKGEGRLKVTTTRITLSPGPLSILDADGSAFIIHVDPDTYCPDGEKKGCAGGARAACGVIVKD
jgi:Cu-Zn family superoxide dismutase